MSQKNYYINRPTNIVPNKLTTSILKNNTAFKFHSSLPYYNPTPLISLKGLSKNFRVNNIYLKNESFRFGLNAFKVLGASYAIHKLLEKNPKISTFCTATDGNHGRAVAWSAKRYAKRSIIFVPENTTDFRIETIEKEGALVEKINGNYDETCNYAEKKSNEKGWQLVQDTASENYEEIPANIMAGYLSIFKELEKQIHTLPKHKIDIVFLQAGVGSFAAAAAWYYNNRYGLKKPKIVLVEPSESSGILESFINEKRTNPTGNLETIMAGLNCGIPSSSAWEILKNTVDISMAVKDIYAKKAIRKLYFPKGIDQKIIGGESGVGGLAGFIAIMTNANLKALKTVLDINEKSNILFYNTEGSTDPENFKKIVNEL